MVHLVKVHCIRHSQRIIFKEGKRKLGGNKQGTSSVSFYPQPHPSKLLLRKLSLTSQRQAECFFLPSTDIVLTGTAIQSLLSDVRGFPNLQTATFDKEPGPNAWDRKPHLGSLTVMISTPELYGISQDTQMTAHSFRAAASHIRTLYAAHFSMNTVISAITGMSFLITSSSSTGCSTDPAQTTNRTQLLSSLIPFPLMLFCFYAF